MARDTIPENWSPNLRLGHVVDRLTTDPRCVLALTDALKFTSRANTPEGYRHFRGITLAILQQTFEGFDELGPNGSRRRFLTVLCEYLFTRLIERVLAPGSRFDAGMLDRFRQGYDPCFQKDVAQWNWLCCHPDKTAADLPSNLDTTYEPTQPMEEVEMTTATQVTLSVPAIEQRTFVYGRDAKDYSDTEIVALIKQLEDEIERCKAVKNKPKSLKKSIEQMQANIQALVELSDSRE
jgi:uncharacterized small protein (DUF1192 family)